MSSKGKLRTEVAWLPTSSSLLVNSSAAVSELAQYREKNDIVLPVTRKDVRRQRAKSMFANRVNAPDQSNDMKSTITELQARFNSPNFGLKPSQHRSLGAKPQQTLSEWQNLSIEFKERVELKLGKK